MKFLDFRDLFRSYGSRFKSLYEDGGCSLHMIIGSWERRVVNMYDFSDVKGHTIG